MELGSETTQGGRNATEKNTKTSKIQKFSKPLKIIKEFKIFYKPLTRVH